MRRPFIAVPAMRSGCITGLRRSGVVGAEKVMEAIFRGGGEPFLLPPGDRVAERLRYAHGAVVPGGADIDPSVYGQSRHDRTGQSDLVQDLYDIAVTRALLAHGLPFLAICRGMQALNVAVGGTLVQHLDEDGAVPHRESVHRVVLEPRCAVAVAMGGNSFDVSSYHHQAVDRLGAGLRAVGHAEDGCIEVVQHDTAPVLAVQWHPEDDADIAGPQQGLFDSTVSAAERRMFTTTRG